MKRKKIVTLEWNRNEAAISSSGSPSPAGRVLYTSAEARDTDTPIPHTVAEFRLSSTSL